MSKAPIRTAIAIALAVAFLTLNALPTAQAAVDGLDPSFGSGGKVTTDFSGSELITTLKIQSDGKIIAGGFSSNAVEARDFALARYTPSGSLDTSFGSGGKVTTDFFSSFDTLFSIVIQPDGRIV